MLISSVQVEGLGATQVLDGLGSLVVLPAGPVGVAVADAIDLALVALDVGRAGETLQRLGIIGHVDQATLLDHQGVTEQGSWSDGAGVQALLRESEGRVVKVTVELTLDPVLFGRLREWAAREPRLVTALGGDARLLLKVGWLFTKDCTAASVSVLKLSVGEVAFPCQAAERPEWMSPLIQEVTARTSRLAWDEPLSDVCERMLSAKLSPDPQARARVQRASEALAQAPFEYGELGLVRAAGRIEPCFGEALIRARQFGRGARDAVKLVEEVWCRQPDVLVVASPGATQGDPEAVVRWLEACTQGDEATLEQVFVVPGGAA